MAHHRAPHLFNANPMPNLTDASIKATTGPAMLWDASLKGFGVRIGKEAKTFIVLIDNKGRRQKLGRYPTLTLSQARNEAKRILAEKQLGRIKPTFTAFEDAKNSYLEHCELNNKESTYRGYKWRLDNRLNFERKNIADITPRLILNVLNQIEAPQEKRYTFIVARSFFNWCVKNHYLDTSPLGRLEVPASSAARDTLVTDNNIKTIWTSVNDDAFGNVVKLLILTGARRGEVEHMRLTGATVTIEAAFTKNRLKHVFPATERIKHLLTMPRKWGGWGKSKKRLDEASGITGWTLHDLRRFYATKQAELGTPIHITERLLNHISGTQAGIVGVYQRHTYFPEQKLAVERYDQFIGELLDESADD